MSLYPSKCLLCSGMGAILDEPLYIETFQGPPPVGVSANLLRSGYAKPCPSCRSEAYRPVLCSHESEAPDVP